MAKKAASKKKLKAAVNDLLGESKTPPVKATTKRATAKRAVPAKVQQIEVITPALSAGEVPEGHFMLRGKAIPAYPPMLANLEEGMKSPAVKEWYRDHHPDLFTHIYPIVLVG